MSNKKAGKGFEIIANPEFLREGNIIDDTLKPHLVVIGGANKNSVNRLKKFYNKLKGRVFIIGVGGVDSGLSAFEKITAGANAVQVYTGFVYGGPSFVKQANQELLKKIELLGISDITEMHV